MHDSARGEELCRDRTAKGEPLPFDWIKSWILPQGRWSKELGRCDPTNPNGCQLGVAKGLVWYGRCFWDPAAQDLLLGQRHLPVRREQFWTVPEALSKDAD